MRKDKKQPFKIPSIFESVYNDYKNGATLEDVAKSLYLCGWKNFIDTEYASEIIAKEAAKEAARN